MGFNKWCHILSCLTHLDANINKWKLKFWILSLSLNLLIFIFWSQTQLSSVHRKKKELALPFQYFQRALYVNWNINILTVLIVRVINFTYLLVDPMYINARAFSVLVEVLPIYSSVWAFVCVACSEFRPWSNYPLLTLITLGTCLPTFLCLVLVKSFIDCESWMVFLATV